MNYRHIYHAGNFADVFKHCVLISLIEHLQQKEKGFSILDTHAGIGLYDLNSEAAQKTQEASQGVLKLLAQSHLPSALASYLKILQPYRLHSTSPLLSQFPGSPAIAAAMLRPQDRLMLNELHPEDAQTLRQTMRRLQNPTRHIAVHEQDAYQALKALLPPTPRRGLVLIDPPFEDTEEFGAIYTGLHHALKRFPMGIYAIWYPIKNTTALRGFQRELTQLGDYPILDLQFYRAPLDQMTLTGTGITLINPPWQFDACMQSLLPSLAQALGLPAQGGGVKITWLQAPRD